MTTSEDGGPAFPTERLQNNPLYHPVFSPAEPQIVPAMYPGMSLRDYFAGQALTALIQQTLEFPVTTMDADGYHRALSDTAYEVADAMLEARKR